MDAIITYMDILSAQLLPSHIYNHIVGAKRSDLYEFKKKNFEFMSLIKGQIYI